MEITPLTASLDVQGIPATETDQTLKLRLLNPFQPEAPPLEINLDSDHFCSVEFSDLDFPSHFHEGMPLLLEILDENGEALHSDPNILIDPNDPLRLEIPLYMPPSEEVEVPVPLVKPEARYLISRALAEFSEVLEGERVDEWVAEQLGQMELLDALADGVLEGNEQATAQMEELLLSIEDEHAADPGAFETALQETLNEVEMSGIHNLPQPSEEEFWPSNAFNGSRLAMVLRAAYQAGKMHSEARAMANLSRIMCGMRSLAPVQIAYDSAIMAYNGNPRPVRAVAEVRGFPRGYSGGPNDGGGPRPPLGPDDGPVPPKGGFTPKVWPPRTVKSPPSPIDEFKKKCFWVIERYLCAFDLLRQLPFDPLQSYQISSVSASAIVCHGETVTIDGSGFDFSGRLYITQGSRKREIPTNSWTDTQIEFTVPYWASSGSLSLQVTYDTKTICGMIRNFYKAGSPVFLKVLELDSSLHIARGGKFPTSSGGTIDLFHITQAGATIRADQGVVKWSTQDAQNCTLNQTDPNGSVTQVGTAFSGTHTFPGSGNSPIDGLYNFELNAGNKCGNEFKTVTADCFVGTKAKVTGLTVDGNGGPIAIFSSNNSVPIAWSVIDETSFKLEIKTFGLNGISKSASFTNPSNPLSSWNAANALVTLEAKGNIRDAAYEDMVKDKREIKVAVEPSIGSFAVSQGTVSYGDSVTFSYKTANGTQIRLLRSGKSPQILNSESGSITVKMDNPTASQETVTLEVTNNVLPAGYATRVASQSLTVNYKPTIKKFELVPQPAVLTQYMNGGQGQVNQTTPAGTDIKLCYNTSQGNNSKPTPQQFRVVVEVYNAPRPQAYVFSGNGRRNVVPLNMFPPNFFPKIDQSFEVKVQVKNAHGQAESTGNVTFLKGRLNYWFCVRKKSSSGPKFQGVKISTQGWSEDEAKAQAFAILSKRTSGAISEKTHTATKVSWDGNCL